VFRKGLENAVKSAENEIFDVEAGVCAKRYCPWQI
jgi:hypothetical protein